MSAMDVSNLTKEFLRKMLKEDKRFDGRKSFDLKALDVEYGVSNKAEGSARVKLGKTEVIAGVKLLPGDPYPDSLDKGNLIVSGDLLPLASPRFEAGPPGFNAIEVPRLIDRMLRESGMIDFKKLVIKEGEKVWNLFVDVYPINDDGSLIDAASIAAVAALRDAIVPALDVDNKIDYEKKSKDKLPLNQDAVPISLTFYKLGDSLFLQPTREEEEACDAKVTFGACEFKGTLMLNSCQKGLETPFTSAELGKMMDILPEKYKELNKSLNKLLK